MDFREEAPAAFKQQFNEVLEAYFGLRNALVAADESEVENTGTSMMATLLKVDGTANADMWGNKTNIELTTKLKHLLFF